MQISLSSLRRLAALSLMVLPTIALAGKPGGTVVTPYCAGTIGIDYPWPAFSDSPDVNKFRDEVVFAMKSFYGFEYDGGIFPEEQVAIGEPPRLLTLPTGWVLAMDAFSPTTAVAIPPRDGPFSDEAGLQALLQRKKAIFGGGGNVTIPVRGDLSKGVRLPCSADDPTKRAPAIVLDVPFPGGAE